jgi:type IV secretory pathway TrbF-like protein
MSSKKACKQKIEAELELVQAKLAEFKARVKILTADARIRHAAQDTTKPKLKERGEANKEVWDLLRYCF